jgi:hypothetical protein
MKFIFLVLTAALLTACALPETAVKTGSPRPAIYIKGAPEGAQLFVDGLAMGTASEFNGAPKILVVEEGTHAVELRHGNAVLHAEKVFVSNGESRAISVNSGSAK